MLSKQTSVREWRLEFQLFLPYQLASRLAQLAYRLAVFAIQFTAVQKFAQIHYTAILLHEKLILVFFH